MWPVGWLWVVRTPCVEPQEMHWLDRVRCWCKGLLLSKLYSKLSLIFCSNKGTGGDGLSSCTIIYWHCRTDRHLSLYVWCIQITNYVHHRLTSKKGIGLLSCIFTWAHIVHNLLFVCIIHTVIDVSQSDNVNKL